MEQSAIKELNSLINEEYKIEINLSKSVILCSYAEGELEESYYVDSIYKVERFSKPEAIKEDLRSVLNFLMEDFVYYGTLEKYYQECFNYTDNDIVTIRFVNENGSEPSEEETELWKSGKYNLFNEYVAFKVVINGTQIDADLISKLIESDEYNVKQVAV